MAARKGKNANKRMIKYLSNNCLSPRIFYFSGALVYGDKSSETANRESIINPTSFSREYYIAEKPFYDMNYLNRMKIFQC